MQVRPMWMVCDHKWYCLFYLIHNRMAMNVKSCDENDISREWAVVVIRIVYGWLMLSKIELWSMWFPCFQNWLDYILLLSEEVRTFYLLIDRINKYSIWLQPKSVSVRTAYKHIKPAVTWIHWQWKISFWSDAYIRTTSDTNTQVTSSS